MSEAPAVEPSRPDPPDGDEPCLDVSPDEWVRAAVDLRDQGFDFFDWLTAVDQTDAADVPGFDVVLHLLDVGTPGRLRGQLVRTRIPEGSALPSLTAVFAGAAWHERETHEMFGIDVSGFDDGSGLGLRPLLLPDGFEGTPLRKSFVLAARASKPWPGAKEPGRDTTRRGQGGDVCRLREYPAGVGTAMTVLEVVLRAVAVLAAFLVLPLLVGQTEHKVMAHMQGRLGPMYAGGFHGWAQLVADGVKFVQKEDVVPVAADRWVFRLAPGVALVPYLVALSVIPLGPNLVGADVDAGALFVVALAGIGILGTLMAGWSSANKYSLLGAMRSAAQLLSYELPIVLTVASVALAAGTLSLTRIVTQWSPWWLLWQLPGAVVFLVAALAELQRPPFDMPVADSEVVFGPFTEYTGLRFAFFLLAEYAGIVLMALLFTVLFLGGWRGPWSDHLGWLWTLVKGFVVAFLVVWFRVAWPRLREDQLQRLAWIWLVPLAIAQVTITGVGVVLVS